MALRRDLPKRLFHRLTVTTRRTAASPSLPAILPAAAAGSVREYMTSPDSAGRGFLRRFLQRRTINQATSSPSTCLSEILNLPVGDRLREKLREMSIAGGDRVRRLDGLAPPPEVEGMTVDDARKIVRAAEAERMKGRVREVAEREGRAVVEYSEFVRICVEACGRVGSGREEKGLEYARLLDQSGNVIVWGNLVFLLPEQVARSMETLICQSIPMPNDPRRKELERMEEQKAQIDKEARKLVIRELYCGLGLLSAQTLCFMRLTFWELSWDVMEPICFFVTTSYFAFAYAFFLRTSKEPSFEGYYQRRFEAKQAKLMRARNFDLDKYRRLIEAFYRTTTANISSSHSLIPQNPAGAFCS